MLKLKCFILILTISTVSGLTSKFTGEDEDIEKLQLRKVIYEAQKHQEKGVNLAVQKFNDTTSFRLPNNTIPIHYDIFLSTDIHNGTFLFNGAVRINISVIEASNTITVHSRRHTILEITIFNADLTEFEANPSSSYENSTEFLTITTERQMTVNQTVIVEIVYQGTLGIFSDVGFFNVPYRDENGQTSWIATTQFQAINARHAFPCYDEIRYRNTISLQIRHHQSYSAISNMPVESVNAEGADYVVTSFQTTPVIPTFQLSFTVSNYASVNRSDDGLPFRAFARREAVEAGEVDNALELSILFLRAMENYFNQSYSFPKADQIAIPEFSSDGSNNWGLYSYHERILLQTNDDPIAQHNREIKIAHEYAHMFFAGLVSPLSWTYLWLNEGFATLYEVTLNDIVFPEKNQWDQFMIDYFDVAMNLDTFDFVNPLNMHAESPSEIRSKFDFITYNKGALILRMFQEAFTEQTWVKGISYYLEEMQFDSADPSDLFRGLQRALNEDFPGTSLNVAALMDTWLNFAGYPVVTVSRNESGIVLSQQGFRTSHAELFSIPINYATASDPTFDDTTASYWLTQETMTIPQANASKPWVEGDWMIVNLRDTGYHVTNYDDNLWSLIIDALDNDHEVIHFLNRGTLFADMHRFITENFDVRATIFLDLMRSLPLEHNSHVWARANLGLFKFEERLRGSRLHSMHMNFLRDIMTPVYGRDFDFLATLVVNHWSCLSGVDQCRLDFLNELIDSMNNVRPIPIDFFDLCNGFLSANETVWMHFFNEALSAIPFDRNPLLIGLLCTTDREILNFYLHQTLNFTNGLQNLERESILLNAARQSEVSFDAVIDFVEENHATIQEYTSVNNVIIALARFTNTECQAERVLYLNRFIPEGTNPGRSFFRSIMISNLNFFDANFDSFHDWYDNYESL